MREKLEQLKGITLIALVVTIILLLILAGISLSVLTGENGLIGKTKKSGQDMEIAAGEEQDKLNSLYSQLLIASNSSAEITVNREQLVEVIREVVKEESLSLDKIYPVGSIYMSMDETNPTDLFGGTWERIEDKFLLASGTTYGANTTGGSADAVLVSHNHTGTTGKMNQNAEHSHALGYDYAASTGAGTGMHIVKFSGYNTAYYRARGTESTNTDHTHNFTTSTQGESGVGKNMPPYMTVYVWKRVA